MKKQKRDALGSKETAEKVAERAQRVVPAYKRFLETQGFKVGESFDRLPQSDKSSYILAYPFQELLADDDEEIFTIFRSSGSSGHPCYWPQLKSHNRSAPTGFKTFLEGAFAVHQKKTLAIVGLALGSWMGGEVFSWALKSMAVDTPYPFWVFSPGNYHDEIIEMIGKIDSFVDQIILVLCPSFIAHLHLRAEQLNQSLPLEKLRYVVTGEPFPESMRASLQNQAGVEEDTPFMFSVYGSADTGGLGVESLATVALRKLLYRNHALARSLGVESPIPHFFHVSAPDAFLESVDDVLCVTRWQGIPLVRYKIHDQVTFFGWKELKQAILASDMLDSGDEPWVRMLSNASNELPDLLAVAGRADSCLILGGTNLTESMLDAAVKSEELNTILTGLYRARILYEQDRQYLALDLEVRKGVSTDDATVDVVYDSLVQTLGQVQNEFLADWRNIYRAWDNVRAKRILRLNFLPWPSLSQETEKTIKHRGIANC